MTVRLLQPDEAPRAHVRRAMPAEPAASAFTRALDAVGAIFEQAQHAEDVYARGSGSLLQAVYERARADVALGVAVAAASRTAQAVQSVLNMQI